MTGRASAVLCVCVYVCEINDTAGQAKGPEQSTFVLALLYIYRLGISRRKIVCPLWLNDVKRLSISKGKRLETLVESRNTLDIEIKAGGSLLPLFPTRYSIVATT